MEQMAGVFPKGIGTQKHMQKVLCIDTLRPGDIVLTSADSVQSAAIRSVTRSDVSHAMLCVDYASVIHATGSGVHSENPQKLFFRLKTSVYIRRWHAPLPNEALSIICAYVRSRVGTEYAHREAALSITRTRPALTRKQFCSRLIAQAYEAAGLGIVADADNCKPSDIQQSQKLITIDRSTVLVTEEEVQQIKNNPNHVTIMTIATNTLLNDARQLNPHIQDLNDLNEFVIRSAEFDCQINDLYRRSGYLDVWRKDQELYPWRYDLSLMKQLPCPESVAQYCRDTLRTDDRDNNRYIETLRAYKAMNAQHPRRTFETLITLYTFLVSRHQTRFDTAAKWLKDSSYS